MVRLTKALCLLSAVLAVCGVANAAIIVSDDWQTNNGLATPDTAPAGVVWTSSGIHEGEGYDSDVQFWYHRLFMNLGSSMSINFGATQANSVVEARLKAFNPWQGGERLTFGLKDTTSGYYYYESARWNQTYGVLEPAVGLNGFHSLYAGETSDPDDMVMNGGLIPGAGMSTDGASWDFLKFRLDPATGVTVWQAQSTNYDAPYDSLTYTKVAEWNNFRNLASVDQFFIDTPGMPWYLHNIEIDGTLAPPPAILTDDWSDGYFNTPAFARNGADWVKESGSITVDGLGRLCVEPNSKMSVTFGATAVNTPVEAHFKLYNRWASNAHLPFVFGFKNTATGYYYEEHASTNASGWGTSGFHNIYATGTGPNDWGYLAGDAPGATLTADVNNPKWDYIKLRFDPASGVVISVASSSVGDLAYDDPSLSYVDVSHWSNIFSIDSVDQFYMASSDLLPWFVDDVEVLGTLAPPPSILTDDWNDGTFNTPTYSANGSDWVSESGSITVDGLGRLCVEPNSKMSVSFGLTKPNSVVEGHFKLFNRWQSTAHLPFTFGFKNTVTGYYYEEHASPNPAGWGNSGFHNLGASGAGPDEWYYLGGDVPGAVLSANVDDPKWDYIKFRLDPVSGCEMWIASSSDGVLAYDDPSLAYTKVAHWSNFFNIANVDQFYMASDAMPWFVDDVEIFGSLDPNVTATPTFTPDGGPCFEPQTVTIGCATPGATISYTTDGSVPSPTHGTQIAPGSTVVVDHTMTLKAKAWAPGYNYSAVKSAVYNFSVFFTDNWNDKTVYKPTHAPANIDWTVENGMFSADAEYMPEDFGFFNAPLSQALMFQTNNNLDLRSRISVNFGPTVIDSNFEARFKLRQTNNADWGSLFIFGVMDSSIGYYYEEHATPNAEYYGSGFHGMYQTGAMPDQWGYNPGDVPGLALSKNPDEWNFIKFKFDPINGIEIWVAFSTDKNKDYNDSSLNYVRVAHWDNFSYLQSVDTFYMDNNDAWLSWLVDDVELEGTLASAPAVTAAPTFTPDGGVCATPQSVKISCATPGATIRYTTDGSDPSQYYGTQIASGSTIVVDHTMTLKAKAWSSLPESSLKAATYTFPTYGRPNTIPYSDSVVVDGDLSDWANADWAPLDQDYHGYASDVLSASYAARWGDNGNKVYVAIKVQDKSFKFTDEYTDWDARDAVEIYLKTTGDGHPSYGALQEDAQQYVIGIKSTDHSSVWTDLGYKNVVPDGFKADGSVSGQWIYYEAEMTPYQYFGGLSGSGNIVSTLSSGQIIGLDVAVVGRDASGYTGMKSENLLLDKSVNYLNFAKHLLTRSWSIGDVKKSANGSVVSCSGIVTAVFGDVFYIESEDRAFGVRVSKASHGVAVGQIVNVEGAIETNTSHERYIAATMITPSGTATAIKPLAVTNKSLGGGYYGSSPNCQEGVDAAYGLSNIGLLVKTTGRIVAKNTSVAPHWFKIDDGSGVSVKVFGSVPSGTPIVAVTGISSCEYSSSSVQRAVLATNVKVIAP